MAWNTFTGLNQIDKAMVKRENAGTHSTLVNIEIPLAMLTIMAGIYGPCPLWPLP